MFRAILETQWKWARVSLLFLAFVSFMLPVASARSDFERGLGVGAVLGHMEASGWYYPMLATVGGVIVAMMTWSADWAGRHVYALSLPLPRWYFVLLRYGAGLVLLLLPMLAMLIGALLASATAHLPPALHPYPGQLSLRFGLSLVLVYSFGFALAGGTRRTATGLGGVITLLFLLWLLLMILGVEADPIAALVDWLFARPGPFEIMTGRWMLFDV